MYFFRINSSIFYKTVRYISVTRCQYKALKPFGGRVSSYITLFEKSKELQLTSLPEREKFATVLKEFMQKEKSRRGHVSFIDGALERMEQFNLEKDLLTYNRLLDIIPKNRYKSRTLFDALWPKPIPQIDLALRVLQKMEDNGVRPDDVTYTLLCEVFGKTSFPVQKCVRLAIAFDKYENIDPYRIKEFPSHQWDISRLALKRMAGEDCHIEEVMVPDSMDEPFIIGATSKLQHERLLSLTSTTAQLLYVEGPHRLWLQKVPVFYYSLRTSAASTQSPADKNDDEFLSLCMCRPPSRDSLVRWIDRLQHSYPSLANKTVVYDVVIVKDVQDWTDCSNKVIGTAS